MRTIRIISDGQALDVVDDQDTPLEEATKELVKMVNSDEVMILIGKKSSAIVRPSSISGIGIFDDDDEAIEELSKQIESLKNEEQNIDVIRDLEE